MLNMISGLSWRER